SDLVRRLNPARRFGSGGGVGAVHNPDRVTRANLVSQFQLGSKTNRGIHCVFDAHAPAADCRDRVTNLRGIDSRNEARARGFYLNVFAYQRQKLPRRVANTRVTTLRLDVASQTLERSPRRE